MCCFRSYIHLKEKNYVCRKSEEFKIYLIISSKLSWILCKQIYAYFSNDASQTIAAIKYFAIFITCILILIIVAHSFMASVCGFSLALFILSFVCSFLHVLSFSLVFHSLMLFLTERLDQFYHIFNHSAMICVQVKEA